MPTPSTDLLAPVRIRVETEDGFEKTILHERGLLRIGSDPASDLRLAHPSVAPCHLLILREGSRHAFTDAGSGRGMWLNGVLALNGYLRHGDVLSFGAGIPYRIQFLTESLRSCDKQEKSLRTLLEASKAINSSLVLDEVLDHVMDSVMEVTSAGKGFLMLVEADGTLRARVARGIDRAALDQEVIPASRTVIQQVVETREPIFMVGNEGPGGFSPNPSTSMVRLKLKTIMCVPLLARDQVIGVIYVDHQNKVMDVTKVDLDILQSLADHASVAIENARLTERMLMAERVSAVGRMVSSIVHDLRAPLTAIRGAAQLLKINPGGEKAPRMTELIIGQVDRMSAMTEEVLDYCRGRTSLDAHVCSLKELLSRTTERIQEEMASRSIRVVLDIEEPAYASLDAGRMERVFRNLFDNAVDAMPLGGTLTIRSAVVNGGIQVLVIDTGCGMTEEVRRRAFEPFFTEGKRNGTGLGMAIARKIVEAHGGKIEIESVQGAGTTILIHLPMVLGAATESAREPAVAGISEG